jgi:hypothetical protein
LQVPVELPVCLLTALAPALALVFKVFALPAWTERWAWPEGDLALRPTDLAAAGWEAPWRVTTSVRSVVQKRVDFIFVVLQRFFSKQPSVQVRRGREGEREEGREESPTRRRR